MTSGRNVRGARKVCPKPPDDLSRGLRTHCPGASGQISIGLNTNLKGNKDDTYFVFLAFPKCRVMKFIKQHENLCKYLEDFTSAKLSTTSL